MAYLAGVSLIAGTGYVLNAQQNGIAQEFRTAIMKDVDIQCKM